MRHRTETDHKIVTLPHARTPGALIPLTRLRNRVVIERIREHMTLAVWADNDLSCDHKHPPFST